MPMSTEDERRYQTRVGFERDGKPLQYRKRDDPKWHEAFWCQWEWEKYDYRLKPEEPKFEEIPIYPMLSDSGVVIWSTKLAADRLVNAGYRRIERFVSRNKVRHVIMEVK